MNIQLKGKLEELCGFWASNNWQHLFIGNREEVHADALEMWEQST